MNSTQIYPANGKSSFKCSAVTDLERIEGKLDDHIKSHDGQKKAYAKQWLTLALLTFFEALKLMQQMRGR